MLFGSALMVFAHGSLLSLGLILPLGPQNTFVLLQGATQPRFIRALPALLTAALCDTILIALAIYGVSLLLLNFPAVRNILGIIGIAFLLFMARNLWRAGVQKQNKPEILPPSRQILYALSVSLLNPHAILDTVAVIGPSAMSYQSHEKWVFAIACISVSWLWFAGLALIGRLVHRYDSNGKMQWLLQRGAAIMMLASAGYLLWLL